METVGTTASHEASFPTTLHPSGNRWRAACDIHLINVNVPTRDAGFGVRATIKLQLDPSLLLLLHLCRILLLLVDLS